MSGRSADRHGLRRHGGGYSSRGRRQRSRDRPDTVALRASAASGCSWVTYGKWNSRRWASSYSTATPSASSVSRHFPQGGAALFDYRVAVQISRFDVSTAGEAVVAATWRVWDRAGTKTRLTASTTTRA